MTTAAGIEASGLEEVAAALTRIGASQEQVAREGLTKFGTVVATEAARLAPKASGAMAASITPVYYGGAGGLSVKATHPAAYTMHAIAMGKSNGGMTFRVPAHTRRGSTVSAYTRFAYIPNRPFLYQALAAKTRELNTAIEAALTKVVTL